MLFTSYTFIAFLIILFLVYYLLPHKWQWVITLCAGLFFYAYAFKDPGKQFGFFFIIITIITTYLSARLIDRNLKIQQEYVKTNKETLDREAKKAYKEKMRKKRLSILTGCLVLNFGILAVLKYTNFAISNVNGVIKLFGSEAAVGSVDFVLPLGISFYTFQSMGYLIDVYRGKYESVRNPFKFALFVSFFPQLIQGPISRYDDMADSLFVPHSFDFTRVSRGIERILWGYFKKVVIADRMLVGVKEIIGAPDTYFGFYVFLGAIFYALELYADFTGGIDITIGIAEVLGIKVRENFERPYFSKSIKEYWRRWHISLGAWFTEYLFYPVSVSKPSLKLSKWSRAHLGEKVGKRLPVYIATISVWLITGIWHGAAWNFVVWGLGNCFFIMLSEELEPLYDKFHKRFNVLGTTPWKIFQILRTFAIMCSLRMLDCYRNVPVTFKMFGTMFTRFNAPEVFREGLWNIGLSIPDYIVLLCGTAVLFTVSMIGRHGDVRKRVFAKNPVVTVSVCSILLILILVFGAYGIGYDASQFIYNQF